MSHERPFSLFVFIDALGWRLFQEHGLLADILEYSQPVESVLGYSCACDPTILTGVMPRVHGHWSFFYLNPTGSRFRSWSWLRNLPTWLTDRGRVRNQLSRLVAWKERFTGYFRLYHVPFEHLHLFDYLETRDIYQPGGIVNPVPTIFDVLRDRAVPFVLSDWRRPERQNLDQMASGIDQGDAQFGYLYLAALDGILHAQGTASAQVPEKLRWYEQELRRLIDAAHRTHGGIRLFVISDHGMADTSRQLNLMAEVDRTGLTFGEDYAAVYDSTMARFWYFSDRAERRIDSVLAAQSLGEIVGEHDLRRYEVFFEDYRFGERIFLMQPGGILCPSFMGRGPVPGMHGYRPEHEDSTALLAANVPLEENVTRLDALYGLMLAEALPTDAAAAERCRVDALRASAHDAYRGSSTKDATGESGAMSVS